MNKVFFTDKPETVLYMKRPDGIADVWIREDIQERETEDGKIWEASEEYLQTRETEEYIRENAQALAHSESVPLPISVDERLDAIEEAIMEIVGVLL